VSTARPASTSFPAYSIPFYRYRAWWWQEYDEPTTLSHRFCESKSRVKRKLVLVTAVLQPLRTFQVWGTDPYYPQPPPTPPPDPHLLQEVNNKILATQQLILAELRHQRRFPLEPLALEVSAITIQPRYRTQGYFDHVAWANHEKEHAW
jgi:hypothetical protein